MRIIENINYVITTDCNRMCPDCCCNIPNKQLYNISWEEILETSKFFKGINRINLTGGEPSLHPEFSNFVPKLKNIFECEFLTIETNGYGFKKFPETFKYFDWIQATSYDENSYKESYDNSDDINFIKSYLSNSKTKVVVGKVIHSLRQGIGNGKICDRGLSETVSYEKGFLYPCCVSSGIENSKNIKLTNNWRKEILTVPLPCDRCWFSI